MVDDGVNPTDTATVTISVYDVNDNAPVFSPPSQSVEISEDTDPGNFVWATFTAEDIDSGDNAVFRSVNTLTFF